MGKLKIAAIVVISLLATVIYQSNQTNNFTAITEIKPASTSEINKYYIFNYLMQNELKKEEKESVNVTKITSSILLNLYLDILRDKLVFENAIRKFNLLDASQYNDDKKYKEAISNLASKIKILNPRDDENNTEVAYHTITFIYDDKEKWKNVLKYTDELANKYVQQILNKEFDVFLLLLKKKLKYQLEDLSVQINNVVSDHDRDTLDRLAYLREQSEIAKQLNIAKNTIEAQLLGNESKLLSNMVSESPFYLRGYLAIDKEIELLSKRTNKDSFNSKLFNLQKKKDRLNKIKL